MEKRIRQTVKKRSSLYTHRLRLEIECPCKLEDDDVLVDFTGCQLCDMVYLDMHYILTHMSHIPKLESHKRLQHAHTLAGMTLMTLTTLITPNIVFSPSFYFLI